MQKLEVYGEHSKVTVLNCIMSLQPFREKVEAERDPDKKTMLQNSLVGNFSLHGCTIYYTYIQAIVI